jgi:hypothetical protein
MENVEKHQIFVLSHKDVNQIMEIVNVVTDLVNVHQVSAVVKKAIVDIQQPTVHRQKDANQN